MSQKACTVRTGRFDGDARDVAERVHPLDHLQVALPRRGEALRAEDSITSINDGRDVQILLREPTQWRLELRDKRRCRPMPDVGEDRVLGGLRRVALG